ncbi:MAG: hypothetical protein COT18_03180 [Elusimicrobia bacterium CG08_land_8_20_14_0_20_59_10]|nr:MAG: hypothetical protein COT18_03180 [Elusimicrobia bacterium CG08_land_8_20_14_0_20_59_10]
MKKAPPQKSTKGDKTRRRILETASAMMAEKGPDGVSMRDISGRLKITKPVLYYYFKNKDELIKSAFLEGTKHFEDFHAEISRPGLTLEARLERIFASHLDFIKRYPDMPKCALKIMASPSAGVLSQMARDLKHRNRKALREMLIASAAKEGLSKTGIDGILHMVSAVIGYFLIEAREKGAESLPKDLPSKLAGLICAGAKHMKALLAALFLASALPAHAETGALSLTVDAAVRTALKNNATVRVAEDTRLIYKEKVDEYWGSVYPQLSASGQYTRNIESPAFFFGGNKIKSGLNNAYAASLDLNQVLWAGGKVSTGIRMARMYSGASDEQLKTARYGISRAVKQMYYAVLLAKALAEIQKESLDLANQHLDTIKARYKEGMASDLAVLRQQVEVSNTEPALTKAKNLYDVGLTDLKNLLGLDPEAELSLSDGFECPPQGPGDITGHYREALTSRPEYRSMKYQLDLYTEMIRIERAGHYPYLSAYASRQFQGQSDSGFPRAAGQSWSTTAGLRLSLPLFSGGAVASKVAQAGMQAGIARTNLAELERKIKIEVKKAWLGISEAAERLKSQTAAVEQARKALEATEVRFKNGLSSQLELNDTSLALNRSQTLYTQARHDVCNADAQLKWTLGK